GHYRRDAGRQEGACRLHRWPARELTIVAWSAARFEASRPDNGAADSGRRWRARVLEGARRGMADSPRATLLGAQDRQHPEQEPKSLHTKAKRALQEIWMAETKKDAVTALEAFVETYQVKYQRATNCLI